MDKELQKLVDQFKVCFSVEGIPAIKSDRFSQEEYDRFCVENNVYKGYAARLVKNHKTYTDEEIGEQIYTVLNTFIDPILLKKKISKMMDMLSYEDESKDKKYVVNEVYKMLGWKTEDNKDGLTPINEEFWVGSGSIPFVISESDYNKKMFNLKTLYGAMGLHEIFGKNIEVFFDIKSILFGTINSFPVEWNKRYDLKIEKNKKYSSNFDSLDDLEDNVVVKNIKSEAIKFYRDKSKNYKERRKVFEKHGNKECYIFHPKDKNLNEIFEKYCDDDQDRHSMIHVSEVIEWWIDIMSEFRTKIVSSGKFNKKIEKTTRNYIPSKTAIKRLERYYMEKLFLEGICKFEFDW